MKLLIPSIMILVAAIIIAVPTSPAQTHRTSPGAVVFGATENYSNGYPQGYSIYVVSQGQHAPQVLPGADLATTIETLLASGFEIRELPGFTFMAIRR